MTGAIALLALRSSPESLGSYWRQPARSRSPGKIRVQSFLDTTQRATARESQISQPNSRR